MRITDAKRYVVPPQNEDDVRFEDADTDDIISLIELADAEEAENCTVGKLAEILRGSNDFETCKNAWSFVRNEIKYIADRKGFERIKKANKTVVDGYGDCKSMTVLLISILRHLGINCKKRFVSWRKNDQITHVYAVAIVKGRGEVLLDAVHTRFNEEVSYAYKIDKAMKVKAAIVRGLKADSEGVAPEAAFLNYTSMTDGELSLQILKERLKLLLAVHPNAAAAKSWRKGLSMIDNAIYKGIHGVSGNTSFVGLLPSELGFVAKRIKESKKRFAAAANVLHLYDRPHVGVGTDPLAQLQDIEATCGKYKTNSWWDDRTYTMKTQPDWQRYDECVRQVDAANRMKTGINENMPKTSHHYIYEFADPKYLRNDNPLRFDAKLKISQHKRVIPNLVFATKLSQSNLTDWQRLSVERAHANKGLGVMSPEAAIEVLKANPEAGYYDEDGNPRIGDPATLIAIAVIIAVSLAGVAGIIQVCKGQEPTAFKDIPDILTAGFGARGNDWKLDRDETDNGGGGGGTNCPTGYVRDTATGQCVPIQNGGGGSNTEGGGINKNLLIAGGVGLGLWALSGK